MMQSFLTAKVSLNILQCQGDQVRFALRVRIFPYPDNAHAVWAMLACHFIQT